MIQLFSLTINNTFDCNFSIREIAKRIKCSRETITKYLAELVENGYIIKTDLGYRLSNDYFFIGKTKFQKQREQQIIEIYNKYENIEYFKKILDNTNWNNVSYLDKYIRSMIGGYMNLKPDKKEINETTIIM
jgi:DNA-binding Lrp family transcriptional regulator